MFRNFNCTLWGGLALACLLCCQITAVQAQLNPASAKQRAFESASNWWEAKAAYRKAQDSLHVLPVMLFETESPGGFTAWISPSSLAHGDSIQWCLLPSPGADFSQLGTPELWIDGTPVAAGWFAPSSFEIPASGSNVMLVEVKFPASNWAMLMTLKNACIPPAPDLPPWPYTMAANPWWVETVTDGVHVAGLALTKLGSDSLFDKPLIVVEGFDPDLNDANPSYGYGTMNWDAIWNCADLAYPNTAAMPVLFDALLAEGFDLVYVDFEDGTRTAQQQASLFSKILDLIGSACTPTGHGVVVGASMGGVIARLGLRQRELEGKEDCIRQFITLDSPHHGAYLPLALQEALGFFSLHDVQAAELMQALNSLAARELLLLTPDGVPNEHLQLLEVLAELGWPATPQCLAISNGHPDVGLPDAGTALLQGEVNAWGIDWAQIQLWPLPGNPYHTASTDNAQVVFDCSLPNLDGNWWENSTLEYTAWVSPDAPHWEAVPASTSPHIQALQYALDASGFDLIEGVDWTAFVPVNSALDSEANSPLKRRAEPFASAPASHCDLTGHVDFLLTFLLQGDDDGGTVVGDAYAFPHWGHLLPHRIFMGGGIIPEGTTWTVGTSAGNGGGGFSWPRFDVRTSPCADPLVIGTGAQLVIGASDGQGTGSLTLQAGQHVTALSGAVIAVGTGSSLVVDSGAVLSLHDCGIDLAEGANLLLKHGSRLELHGSCPWLLPQGGTCVLQGEVILAPGAVWDFTVANGASLLAEGDVLLPQGAEWRMQGEPNASDVWIQGNARILGEGTTRWSSLGLIFDQSSTLTASAKQRWNHVDCWGTSESTIISSNRWRWKGGASDRMELYHSNGLAADPFWEDVQFCNSSIVTTGGDPHIAGCSFLSSSWMGSAPLSGVWSHCSWENGLGQTGLFIQSPASPVHLEACLFTGYDVGVHVSSGTCELACCNLSECNEAVRASDGAIIRMNGLNGGGNSLFENGVHGVFEDAPWWECADGANSFGPTWTYAFSGSVAVPNVSGPSSFMLAATGNAWSPSPTQLSLDWGPTHPGTLQLVYSPTSSAVPCAEAPSGPIPASGGIKQLPGTTAGQWAAPSEGLASLRNVSGQLVWGPNRLNQGELLDFSEFCTGVYLFQWLPDGTEPQTHSILIP